MAGSRRVAAFRQGAFLLAAAVSALLFPLSDAGAFTRPGTTERISRTYDGTPVDGPSAHPKLSADGRMVVFTSSASNLVPADTNEQEDVFVHDRQTGQTRFVAAAPDGTAPRFRNLEGAISADGRFVVFYSLGRLRPEDPGTGLVYVKDLMTGALELISVADDESAPNGPSFMNITMNVISADNRYVVFMSRATNLVPGFTPTITGYHIYVRDRVAGRTELVSIGSDGQPASENGQTPAISADGRFVAWETRAKLVPEDTGNAMDLYLRDRMANTTELISVSWDGQTANDDSWRPRLSADGRFVTFDSTASNLVPRDIAGIQPDTFVRDRLLSRTERVSVTSAGEQIDGHAFRTSISGDGRYVAFWTDATNMVLGGKESIPDVYVRDLVTGRTELVSVAIDGGFGNNSSQVPAISADSATVAWFGLATNLTADHDGATFNHVYVRERGPTLGSYAVDVRVMPGSVAVAGSAAFAGHVAAEAADVAGDAGTGGEQLGADLAGASLSWRPEEGDVLVRWQVTNIPPVDVPDLTYGLRLSAGGRRYEVRAQGFGAPNTSANGDFGLYECEPVCLPVADLRGSYGTVGAEVQAAVPVQLLGSPGLLTALEAYTAPAQGAGASVAPFDTLALPDAALPAPEVRVAIAPVGAEPDASVAVPLSGGRFSTSLDTSLLGPGTYDVVVSSCLGVCATQRYPVEIGPPTAVTVAAFTARQTMRGILVRWRLEQEGALLGFNVYREQRRSLVKLNRRLIRGVFGITAGRSYSWLDRRPAKGISKYRLEAVGVDGTRNWIGSISVVGQRARRLP